MYLILCDMQLLCYSKDIWIFFDRSCIVCIACITCIVYIVCMVCMVWYSMYSVYRVYSVFTTNDFFGRTRVLYVKL